MSQHDGVIDNATGAAFRADLNLFLLAILSNSSGATEPATMYAYQWWADTTTGLLKIRNAANSAWVTIGTLASTNLGLLSKAGGTMTGAILAAAGASASAPDIGWSGDTNTGIYRAGADLLGLVAGGTELLRVDGVLNYVKLLSTAGVLIPSGTTAQRPTGVSGIIRWNSTLNQFEGYGASSWAPIGGGGGGAGFQWKAVSGNAAVETELYNEQGYLFSAGLAQELYCSLKVPQSYTAGTQIFMYVAGLSTSSSNTILLQSQSTLIANNSTAFDSTTNQRTSTNSALTNTVAKMLRTFILDITDSSGQINSVAVAAGDVIKVRLYRGTDSDTADIFMIPNSTDVKTTA